MYTKILIRYGELVLKKKNRKLFVNVLANNIKHIVGVEPRVEFDRMYLPYSEENMKNLQYVFGISSYSPVKEVENDVEAIKNAALESVSSTSKTFKIAARRNNKSFPIQSGEMNNILGGHILRNTSLKVDVNNPDQTIYVEVRKETTYVFSHYEEGLGGLPVGVTGRTLHLMSGGIDSPVAAFLLMKRGMKVDLLNFITPPSTDERTVEKIKALAGVINKYQVTTNILFADYSNLMNYLSMTSMQSYKITLMRRSFYRIAQEVAKKHKTLVLSNGDNLAQVASQTLESISTISSATDMQILRPLLTFDKIETINIAKKIGSYDISIMKANETCELFAPKEPVTKPSVLQAQKLEQELSMIPDLEKDLIENKIERVKLSLAK
ncbi:tRNA uracil 4-sulfurtransferase ThiI [Mycoplasma sp. Ms02]|uniref:tRNA uracil 4-sulfurtransferase ThiI n=1 Tax=Mycoplasma sp. Ms02 TaxID=353851 RepID=UPI001C8A193B|nr:tRNA uracil 4-sulfurtransferase ThiI [Mycoplasma sp. Ms02]QZE12173.1 tRNA 4-thiouridine(8) synthase ThiI [Mycoplasma sp. Ms02]